MPNSEEATKSRPASAPPLWGRSWARPPVAAVTPLLALLLAWGGAPAQASPSQDQAPLIALHYEDLLATEPAFIDLFIPPPPLEEWNEVSYQADDCLQGNGVLAGPPENVLIVRFDVPGTGSCISLVQLVFSNAHDQWPASALVVVNRLPDLPPFVGYTPRFSTGHVSVPTTRFDVRNPPMLRISIDNPGTQALLIHGLGNDAAFAEHIGSAFRFNPKEFHGRYSDLTKHGSPFRAALLEPGEAADFALVLDPGRRLPTGAGTITVKPIAILEVAGQRYTLALPRLSAAWGAELP